MGGFTKAFKLFFCMIIIMQEAPVARTEAILSASEPIIGVATENVTLEWTYNSSTSPNEVNFYVGDTHGSSLQKIWKLEFKDKLVLKERTDIILGATGAIFNNNTEITREGSKSFSLIINSVPSTIESFRFVCKVIQGKWSLPLEKEVRVKLASEPFIDFKVRNSNGNSTVGGELDVVCAARGYPIPLVTIKKQSNSQTIILKSSLQNATYSVAKLQPSDSGKYICIAKNIVKSVEEEVLVTVKHKPVVNFTLIKGSEHIKMGDEIKMYCSATGFPAPQLFLKVESDAGLEEIKNSMKQISFSMSNIQPNDARKYVCMAKNIAGISRKEKSISVQYIKATGKLQHSFTVKSASRLPLNCDVTGSPTPTFSWYKGKKKLQSQTKSINIHLKDDNAFGQYTCKASNNAGEESISFSIIKAYISKEASKKSFISKIGEKKTLECPVSGNPKISHAWYKAKSKISESRTLDVTLDKKDKFGNYTCLGKNDAGEETVVFTLKQGPTKESRDSGISSADVLTFQLLTTVVAILALYMNS